MELLCGYWDVDAKIYSDHIVMDVTNIAPVPDNVSVPSEFLTPENTVRVVADRFVGVSGRIPDTWNQFMAYHTFRANPAGDDTDAMDSIGIVMTYDDASGRIIVDGLRFNGDATYDCRLCIRSKMVR